MSEYIHGFCFTNLDERKQTEWPQVFAALPRVGDQVQGTQGELRPILRVVANTHTLDRDGKPQLRIELHK